MELFINYPMLKIPTPQSPVKEITTMHLKLSQKIPILGWGFRFLFKNGSLLKNYI